MSISGNWKSRTPSRRRFIAGTAALGAATVGSALLPAPAVFAQAAPKHTLRLSYGTTAQSALGRSMEPFSQRVAQLTGGQVKVEIFPSGTLFTDTQALEALQTGTLELAQNTLLATAAKTTSVLDLPYLFKSLDHWNAAVHGKPGEMITAEAEKVGLRALGFRVGGWRDVYTTRKELSSIENFKGLKLRTIQSASLVELFKALGVTATPMAWGEVYLGLQQGTVDGAEGTMTSLWDAKHHEVSKYVLRTQHALTTNVLLASEIIWKALDPAFREAIRTAAREQDDAQLKDYINDERQIVDKLKSVGMAVSDMNKQPLIDVAKASVYPQHVSNAGQRMLFEEISKLA